MSNRKDRRVSYGLGQIFSTPAGGRTRAVTRGQQRRRESLRVTPTGFANKIEPLDVNDLNYVLERHGISPLLNPNKPSQPPSSNREVHEMLRVLLGKIDKPSAAEQNLPQAALKLAKLLGYEGDPRVQRIFSSQYFIANTESTWPAVLPLLAFFARLVNSCEVPVLRPEEGMNLEDRITIKALDHFHGRADSSGLEEHLLVMRRELEQNKQVCAEQDAQIAALEHEHELHAQLDRDKATAAADRERLMAYKKHIEPALDAARSTLEQETLKLIKLREEDERLAAIQAELEQKLEQDGVSMTDAQEMRDHATMLEQDLERARARIADLEAKSEAARTTAAEVRPKVRQLLDTAINELVDSQQFGPESLDSDILETAHQLTLALDAERQDAEQRFLDVHQENMNCREQKELVFRNLCREQDAVGDLQREIAELKVETTRMERECETSRALANAEHEQARKQYDFLKQQAEREHDETKTQLEAAQAKGARLSGEVFETFAPIKARIEEKLRLLDRLNQELRPSVDLLQSSTEKLVQLAQTAREQVAALPTIEDPMLPDPDQLCAKLSEEFVQRLREMAESEWDV